MMARRKRICPAGEVFHVLNRAVARLTIFEKPADYAAFMRVLDETWELVPLPIFAMVAMPNHWHFVVRPTTDDQVSEFFRRLASAWKPPRDQEDDHEKRPDRGPSIEEQTRADFESQDFFAALGS